MSSEKSFDKFNVSKRRKVGEEQFAVECNLSIESGEEPQKVLSASAISNVDNLTSNNETTVNGKLTLNVIYLTNDNLVGSQVSVCPWTAKVSGETTGYVYATSKVVEKNVESINGTNVKVVCILEVSVYEVSNCEINSISSQREDVCLKEKELETTCLFTTSEQSFIEENSLTVKEKVKSVLSYQSGVILKSYSPGYNFVTLQGDIVTRLVYVVDDNRDKICTTIVTNSFKQELEIEGVTKDDLLEAMANVNHSEVSVTIDENESDTAIKVNIPINAKVLVFRKNMVMTISDLYSTQNKINSTTESYSENTLLGCDYFESKVEGNLVLSDDTLRVDKLLGVTGEGFVESNVYNQNGEITIEGVAFGSLVYLNDETGTINSVEVEFPFVVSEKAKYDDAELSVKITLTDIDAMVKRGREVFFDAKLKASVCYYEDKTNAVITNIEFGEEINLHTHPIEVYFASSGESLWEIAKELKVKDSFILEQNPNLVDPLEKDEKIVLYFQKNKE